MQKRRYHDFPLKIFCLTVPKKFVGEPFCVSENVWFRKILWMREREREREREGGGGREGESRFSVEIVLSHSTEKFRKRTLPGFRKILVSELFMHKSGEAVSRVSVVIFMLKNVCKGWDSNPFLSLQNPFVVPTVPWELLEWNF